MTRSLTITNALVFDGEAADLVEGDVRIEAGTVVEVAPGAGAPPDGEVVDAAGRVVVPGLIDNHCHAYGHSLDVERSESTRLSYVALKGARRLGDALRRGFTTVRDVAGGDIGFARALREGVTPAPRYLYTGPGLSQTGGHGDARHPDYLTCCLQDHMVEIVDGPDALRVAVRERLRTGAHAIKIMASGGVVSLTDPIRVPQYTAEEIAAVTGEATRRGTYVTAHAYSAEAVTHAVTNGVTCIEHGNLIDAGTAALMAARSVALVPTLVTYWAMDRYGEALGLAEVARAKNAEVLDHGKRAVELAAAAGLLIGFGTDLMGDLEREQLRGLEQQHEVQGTLGVLRSVTSRNADILGDGTLGRLRPGSTGDAVILTGNPFDEPRVLWTQSEDRVVVQAGERVR